MPITKEEIEQARRDTKNEKNQRRMEKEIYGEPLPMPKPGKQEQIQTLPGKPEKKKPLGEDAINYRRGGKIKKYADGGMTQQPTYPFYGNQPQAGGQNGGVNQTFNMQPQAQAGPNDQMGQQQRFKKGGQVKASAMKPVKMAKPKMGSASSRADGIASRGKTRGRMV